MRTPGQTMFADTCEEVLEKLQSKNESQGAKGNIDVHVILEFSAEREDMDIRKHTRKWEKHAHSNEVVNVGQPAQH